MKKHFRMLYLLPSVILLCSCASKSVPVASEQIPVSQWSYEEEAIHLDLKADSQLNLYDGNPHTLHICVYQLRDPNAFEPLTGDEDGLYELLECGSFDPSVRSSKILIMRPGQHANISLDRAEETKCVAIVAGYYSLEKDGIIRLFDIPEVVEKAGTFGRTKTARPGKLNIELALGPQQIDTPSQVLQEVHKTRGTTEENYKASQKADQTTEEGGKTIKENIETVKETAEKAKETAETIQKTGETIQKTQEAGKTIQKTTKPIPKGWGR